MSQLLSTAADAEKQPKRRAMVDAAESLFLQHGYEATSMDAVARMAGVSKATLYAHFTSKDLLFATIVGERGVMLKLDEGDFPEQVDDLTGALNRIGLRWMDFMMRPRTLAIYRIAVAESARFPELGRAFYDNGPVRTRARLADWLAGLRAKHLIEADDLDIAAMQFQALLRGSMFMSAALALDPMPDEAEIARSVRAAVSTWVRAFGRRDVPPAAA